MIKIVRGLRLARSLKWKWGKLGRASKMEEFNQAEVDKANHLAAARQYLRHGEFEKASAEVLAAKRCAKVTKADLDPFNALMDAIEEGNSWNPTK